MTSRLFLLALVALLATSCRRDYTPDATPVSPKLSLVLQACSDKGDADTAQTLGIHTVYLTGQRLDLSGMVTGGYVSPTGGGPFGVVLLFNTAGSEALRDFSSRHIGEQVAITANGKLLMAPVIQSELTDSIQITGDFSQAEAQALFDSFLATPE